MSARCVTRVLVAAAVGVAALSVPAEALQQRGGTPTASRDAAAAMKAAEEKARREIESLAGDSVAKAATPKSWRERLRDAAKRTADATVKSAEERARREVDGLAGDAVAEIVADGRFVAVLSPWATRDGTGRAELARFSGWAVAVSTGAGHQIILCDASAARPWSTAFTVRDDRVPSADRARGADHAAPAALVAGREYALPSDRVTVGIVAPGARVGGAAEGTFKVASVSGDLWVGAAKLTFAQVALPGETNPAEVEFGVTFRARVPQPGEQLPACSGPRQ